MAVANISAGTDVRNNRLTTLVSGTENEIIALKATAAGLSVSAYLRELALGTRIESSDPAALRQVDLMIDRMESDLDSAIAELAAAMSRMAAA